MPQEDWYRCNELADHGRQHQHHHVQHLYPYEGGDAELGYGEFGTGSRQESCTTFGMSLRWFPVFVVGCIIAWSYYVFVVKLTIGELSGVGDEDHLWLQILYLVLYHVLLLMFILSFVKTIFTSPGHVPSCWQLSPSMRQSLNDAKSEEEWMATLHTFVAQQGIVVHQRSQQGAVRYCDKCHVIKPDRCHHCSICQRCVLKMDHHCPWVNNCVGYGNYKFFFLFVTYAYAFCILLIICLVIRLVEYWKAGDTFAEVSIHYIMLCFVSAIFFFFLSSLFWYHFYLILRNRSTLEEFRAPVTAGGSENKYLYNIGMLANIRQVLGDCIFLWFLPVSNINDKTLDGGVLFPCNLQDHSEEQRCINLVEMHRSVSVAGKTAASNGNDGQIVGTVVVVANTQNGKVVAV